MFKKKEKACRGFGGAEVKDWETKSMLTLCHRHRKKFIQKWYKIAKEVNMERKRYVSLKKPDKEIMFRK